MEMENSLLAIDVLLEPISPEWPAGEDIHKSGVYEQVREHQRTEDPTGVVDKAYGSLLPGQSRKANWDEILNLCYRELRSRTKDINLAAWLAESLARKYGLPGFATGLKFVNCLLGRFWTQMYPLARTDPDWLDLRALRLGN